jgi:hypothetical protein
MVTPGVTWKSVVLASSRVSSNLLSSPGFESTSCESYDIGAELPEDFGDASGVLAAIHPDAPVNIVGNGPEPVFGRLFCRVNRHGRGRMAPKAIIL